MKDYYKIKDVFRGVRCMNEVIGRMKVYVGFGKFLDLEIIL